MAFLLKSLRNGGWQITAVLSGLLVSSPVLAESDIIELDGITVTATRAARAIADVPETVIVIDKQAIQKQLAASSDPADAIAKLIPGYSVSNQSMSSASETFRGRSVLILVDGIRRNTPLRNVSRITSLIDLNTIERIEVVAGSSSIYGSGATGGIINFITKKGEEGKPVVSVSTSLRAFTADIGESLTPEASLSVSGKKNGTNYFISLTGRKSQKTFDGVGNELPSDAMLGQGGADRLAYGNGRVGVGHDFGSRSIGVSAEWTYADQKPDYFSRYPGLYLTPGGGIGVNTNRNVQPDYTDPYTGDSINENSKYYSGFYKDTKFALGSLAVEVYHNDVKKRFGYTKLSEVNPFVYYDPFSANPFEHNQTTLKSKRTGSKLTVDSNLDWVAPGVKLTWGGDLSYDETGQFNSNGDDVVAPMSQTNYAGFAQLEVPVGGKVTVRGGIRHEKFDLSVDDFVRPTAFAAIVTPAGVSLSPFAPVPVIGGDFEYDATTYNLGAVVKLTPNVRLHGNFSQGFELPDVGAFTRRAMNTFPNGVPNPGDSTPVDFSTIAPEAQLVNSYEVGLNGSWSNLTASITGFITTSDEGITFDTVTHRLSQQKERIYGVEVTADYRVNDALKIGGILAYREGKYDTDDDGDVDTYLPNNRLATPFRGLAYASYVFASGLNLRGELEFFSGRDHDDTGISREYDIEGAMTANILGSYPLGNGTLNFAAKNLLDLEYENPTATATRNIPVNANGRTVSVGYSIKF